MNKLKVQDINRGSLELTKEVFRVTRLSGTQVSNWNRINQSWLHHKAAVLKDGIIVAETVTAPGYAHRLLYQLFGRYSHSSVLHVNSIHRPTA
jgi:hypothetical protein